MVHWCTFIFFSTILFVSLNWQIHQWKVPLGAHLTWLFSEKAELSSFKDIFHLHKMKFLCRFCWFTILLFKSYIKYMCHEISPYPELKYLKIFFSWIIDTTKFIKTCVQWVMSRFFDFSFLEINTFKPIRSIESVSCV